MVCVRVYLIGMCLRHSMIWLSLSFLKDKEGEGRGGRCWGGRVSDKNLTQYAKFFDLLERGDTILADRGFTIAEDLGKGFRIQISNQGTNKHRG